MNDQFDELGYAVYPNPFAPSVLDNLRLDAEHVRDEILKEMNFNQAPDFRVTWWRLADCTPYLLKIKPVLDSAPSAAKLASGFWMRATLGELLGGTPQLMEDKFMYKQRLDFGADWADLPQLGEDVCKHTDSAYFQARGFARVITVAVCLDDCTADAGALKVWPGSHRRAVAMNTTTHQGPVVPNADAPDNQAVLLTAPAGSVIAWDAALVHASDANRSGKPRRLLVLGYSAAEGA